MTEAERLASILGRAKELDGQLAQRAKLYAVMLAPEIAEEFERIRTVELGPIIKLAEIS